jgi:hypothetical protein
VEVQVFGNTYVGGLSRSEEAKKYLVGLSIVVQIVARGSSLGFK